MIYNLQLIYVFIDYIFFSYFEDVMLDVGVDMDGYWNGLVFS